MNTKSIIVGSAPLSADLIDADLSDYYRIALNKAWRLRPDFQAHVFLESLKSEDRPPKTYRAKSVSRANFGPALNKAGGPFLCSVSVTFAAAFWAVVRQRQKVISVYGCDMVFPGKDSESPSHFYGSGDQGPLLGTFIFNRDYAHKSARLFTFALQHRLLILNGSGQDGTKLGLPIVRLGDETSDLRRMVLSHPIAHDILRKGQEAFITEARLRTDAFDQRLLKFNTDPSVPPILEEMTRAWDPVVDLIAQLQTDVITPATQ